MGSTDYVELVRMSTSAKSPKILVKSRSKVSLKDAPVSPPGITTSPTPQHGWEVAVVSPEHSNVDLSDWMEELHDVIIFHYHI